MTLGGHGAAPYGEEFRAFPVAERRGIGAGLIFQAVVIEIAIQFLPHGGTAAVQTGLDHVGAQFEDLGSLLRGELLQVAQQDDGAVGGGQFGDDSVENGAEFGVENGAFGLGGGIGEFRGGGQIVEGEFVGRREDALAALHEAGILGDAEDPGTHALGVAQLGEILKNAEERFLGYLFGVLRAAAHEPTVVKHFGAEMVYEALKGVGFAGEQGARQFGLAGLIHALILACRRTRTPGKARRPS